MISPPASRAIGHLVDGLAEMRGHAIPEVAELAEWATAGLLAALTPPASDGAALAAAVASQLATFNDELRARLDRLRGALQ